MSTYNGESYIREQIDSILSQTYKDWRLLIRDDGSSDKTLEIVYDYSKKFDKIYPIKDNRKHLGPQMSYFELLNHSSADYIMFCDQDDVWLPYKIEATLGKMRELEKIYHEKPLLIHSDLKVVDENLKVISDSFWNYQKLNPDLKVLNSLLIQNNVTGCSVMINRKLRDLLKSFPHNAIMHDWWIALVSSAFGTIGHIDEPLVLYRQHGSNDTGAKKYSIKYFLGRAMKFRDSIESNKKIIDQGRDFYSIYSNVLTKEQKEVVYNFITLFETGRLRRAYRIFKYRFFKYGFLRNCGFVCVMLISNKRGVKTEIKR
ncbi:Glycosyltransferase, GT2 family [Thermodesulfobium acidiphilum]|uniref:Glycosyltransferase, GT2 family n=1 Tax=Thermodesulfobium acidiphilum TaxID=1794699 RepID=A0A2R4VZ17_THEAF|nr:glycosyltransferase family 2 protein [Thermodesulfobium acidiphilum]AWB09762.1 Glycosyltransferase, GT2 family [Thermodesulfobium acidiphilum]